MKQPPLFKPFRALGYITDNVPFAVQRRGKETFVTVSVGKAWQVYNTGKLTLVLVGPQFKGSIRALAVKGDLTFAAVGRDVVECKRVHRSGVYGGVHTAPIVTMLVMGHLLLTLGQDGQLAAWKIGSYSKPEAVTQLPEGFVPTCLAHPDTYLNKVVVGSEGGQLALVNFVTGALLYTFAGWGSGVRCVVGSPALDVVGVGLADGRAALLNLRYDETLWVASNAAGVGLGPETFIGAAAGSAPGVAGPQVPGAAAEGGAGGAGCCALAFRTGAGVPLMAAGGGAGVVTVWNLEERRLFTVIRDAHDARLVSLHFFAGEPLLMSSGADNAVKQWVWDNTDAQPAARLLRFRSGHAAPPTLCAHYGEGLRLLSAGCDRAFRVFSTIQDQQSRELSQRHTGRKAKKLRVREADVKLGRVVGLDACTVRERDWANVITAHEGDPTAYVWRLAHFTLGEHELSPPQEPGAGGAGRGSKAASQPSGGRTGAPVTAVALSPCGNFGMVGSAAGRLDRYNMQSGLHRGVYGRVPGASPQQEQAQPAAPAAQQGLQGATPVLLPAHDGAITGVAVDSCNKVMVSCGLDGMLRAWDFRTLKLQGEVSCGAPVSRLTLHAGSGLVAVACDDGVLRVYDVEAGLRLVRRFRGHRDRVTGLQLSADCRWLLCSSMDGCLRVYDVPAAQCLQCLRLGSPVTAFSLSPALDMLATCHTNRRGLYLWSNQAVFGNPADFVHSEAPVSVTLPRLSQGLPGKGAQQGEEGSKGEAGGRVRIAGSAKTGVTDGDSDEEDGGKGAGAEGDEDEEGGVRRMVEEGDSSSDEDEEGWSGSEEEEGGSEEPSRSSDGQGGSEGNATAAAAAAVAPYEAVDAATGAPAPIAPALVTLSLLPRSQWQSLAHLAAIKARNKPLEPPKKPEAAPFFLPTLPGLDPNPVWDPAAAATSTATDGADAATAGAASRVLKRGRAEGAAQQQLPVFLRLLREGVASGEWASFVAHLRGLSAAALDREVRALQLLPGEEGGAEEHKEEDGDNGEGNGVDPTSPRASDVCGLLSCVADQLAAGTNWEFCQALLQLVLQVHGDAVAERPSLRRAATKVLGALQPGWSRLDGALRDVRCMVSYFGNLQG